jgi:cell division septation protein DedD
MNKVVAILGIVVLITLGGLFFCAGFFTGTTVFPTLQSANVKNGDGADSDSSSEKGVSLKDAEAAVDSKSAGISDKILAILASAAESASSSISDITDKKSSHADASSHVTVDSLLREIAAAHAMDDSCSVETTKQKISVPVPVNPHSLHGKRIVFVGYFKNNIALEIQEVLTEKGYNAHVEVSRTGSGESFIFCGPFKKTKNAEKLVKWLRKHDFSEARIVSVSADAVEETLYDAINDDVGPPENAEKDIPEMPLPPPPILTQPVPVSVPQIQQYNQVQQNQQIMQ